MSEKPDVVGELAMHLAASLEVELEPIDRADAQSLINMIRRRSPEWIAELIGGGIITEWTPDPNHDEYEDGGVLYKPLHGWTCTCDDRPERQPLRSRVVGPWVEVDA